MARGPVTSTAPAKLLVVDPDPQRTERTAELFGQHLLLRAGSAAAAREALERSQPDLALLAADLEGSGELLDRLGELDVPAVVTEAVAEDQGTWLGAGAVEVLAPGVDAEVLRVRVATQLQLGATSDALEKESAARGLMESRLRFIARHDALTHCLNRDAFLAQLRSLISNPAHRNAAWLIYLDLDRLRVINDAADPQAGDALIRDAAALIKQSVADSDIVGRVGDNAFAAICYGGDQPTIEARAERMAGGVRELRVEWEDKRYKTTASIAVLHLGSEFSSASQVLNVADSTCLAAKNAGRSKIRVHRGAVGETVRILRAEMSWAARLRDSIDRGRFQLMRQEIVPLRGNPTGERFEVLIRMLGERDELIGAGAFLPAAERYDVIREIDRWVITRVFDWLKSRPAVALCSINISGQSVNDGNFAEFVEEALAKSQVSPEVVCFELTETAAVSNLEQVAELMSRLRGRGLRFALDDFGSGFSSYAYLKSLPVDHVKIDGMFVKDILNDSVDEAMVASANQLAHLTGKATIAEFVESTEIAEKLAKLGVDYGQGFGLARPRPLD